MLGSVGRELDRIGVEIEHKRLESVRLSEASYRGPRGNYVTNAMS